MKKGFKSPTQAFKGEFSTKKVVQDKKEKEPNWIFDFLNDLTSKKNFIINDYSIKSYNPFLINKWMACSNHTVLYAQELNLRPLLLEEKLSHYLWYFLSIPKGKVFFNWNKKEKSEDDVKIELIAKYYGISKKEAERYLPFVDDNDVLMLEKHYDEGGIKKVSKHKRKEE